jgi:hypothetical protein
MNISHNTLAIGSGIMLLFIVIGVYIANTLSSQPAPEEMVVPVVETEDAEGTVVVPEITLTEVDTNVDTSVTLDLSGKGLEQVPNYVFQKTELEMLNLSDNNLSGALQAEVRFLSNLKVLDLSRNNFTGVPAEIGQLSNLEVLNLSNNSLTGLPYELGNLTNLKTLDLRGNTAAPADVERIRNSLPASTNIFE